MCGCRPVSPTPRTFGPSRCARLLARLRLRSRLAINGPLRGIPHRHDVPYHRGRSAELSSMWVPEVHMAARAEHHQHDRTYAAVSRRSSVAGRPQIVQRLRLLCPSAPENQVFPIPACAIDTKRDAVQRPVLRFMQEFAEGGDCSFVVKDIACSGHSGNPRVGPTRYETRA